MKKQAKDLEPLDVIVTPEGRLLPVWGPVKCQGGQILAPVKFQNQKHVCHFLPCEEVEVVDQD